MAIYEECSLEVKGILLMRLGRKEIKGKNEGSRDENTHLENEIIRTEQVEDISEAVLPHNY